MNVFELIKEKLEEVKHNVYEYSHSSQYEPTETEVVDYEDAISIVDEVEQEYNKRYEPARDLLEFGIDGYNLHLKERYRKGYEDASNDRWILCSERMPNEDEWVLVTTGDNNVDLNRLRNGKWIGYFRDIVIIAWQPLPAPYKEGGVDDGK